MKDPRHYQIAILGVLLTIGLATLGFDVGILQVLVTLGAAIGTQYICGKAVGLPRIDMRSPLITALSLCLLLRTDTLWLAAMGAGVAIVSKFLIRVDGRHLFNPANVALVAMIAVSDSAWVSAGQWGQTTVAAFALTCLGLIVVTRASRTDIAFGFIAIYALLLLARALWLGDPLAIPLYRLQNGALVLFTFFMITDPMTTPASRAGRLLFAALVACGALVVDYGLYANNGILWSLAVCSTTVPLINRLLPGESYHWTRVRPEPRGTSHDSTSNCGRAFDGNIARG